MLTAILAAASLAFAEADADFAYACASNLVAMCTPRDAGTPDGGRAADWISQTAAAVGVNVARDTFEAKAQRAGGGMAVCRFVNLSASFETCPGAPWTVLISHYDTKPGTLCPGANDGASTTGLLLALAAAMRRQGSVGRTNVMLLWLDGEECRDSYSEHDGLWGSKRAAEAFQSRALDVKAVVCLDMLGDRDLDIMMPANGSPTLMKVVKAAAKDTGVDVMCVDKIVRDDHVAFLEAGYPAVDLIDFHYGSAPGLNNWWHTPQDTPDKISRASLLKAGRLVAQIVNLLSR